MRLSFVMPTYNEAGNISRLIAAIRRQADLKLYTKELVVGSRYIPGGGMHQTEASRWQYFLSKWGNYFVNRCWLNLPVHESLSGFIVVKRAVLNKLPVKSIFRGYGEYCIRLLYYACRKGFKIKEVPVMYGLRKYGVSKSSLKRMIYYYSKTAWQLRFS